MRRARGWALALACAGALWGCEQSGDGMAGTGSAGGNPLVFSAEVEESNEISEVKLRGGALWLGEVRVEHGYQEAQGCLEETRLRVDRRLALPLRRLSLEELRVAVPCLLELSAPEGEAILEITAELAQRWRLRFFAPALQVHVDPERFSQGDEFFLLISLDALLAQIDPALLLALLDGEDSPELVTRLVENLLGAVKIYVDPTPGDGALTAQERVPENIVATLSIVGEVQVELGRE
jgi:hypothetical protein